MFKYIKTADMLKQIILNKRQLKQVLYNQKALNSLPHTSIDQSKKQLSTAATYSLLSLVTNNYEKFDTFVERIQSRLKEHVKNRFLTIVMTAEFVNTGKIQGGGKLKKIIISNIDLLPEIDKMSKINKQAVQLRLINRKTAPKSFNKNIKENVSKIQQAQAMFQKFKNHFSQEKHYKQNQIVKNLYHLSAQQYQHAIQQNAQILKSQSIVIQSFSSSLPAWLLLQGIEESGLKSFRIMDACSAPGNKTIQLAEYAQKQGFVRKILAFEKDPKRFQVLNKTVEKHKMNKQIQTFNQNYLQTSPSQFKNVKLILLDPSCSGSGMLSNYTRDRDWAQGQGQGKNEQNPLNPIPDQTIIPFQKYCELQYNNLNQKHKQRVESLHNFQLQLLNHAAKFKPKRISYSTCSIYKRENQDVVSQFLKNNTEYKIKKNLIIEKNLGKYCLQRGFGKGFQNCVRVDPRKKQTDGFFVTIFYHKKN